MTKNIFPEKLWWPTWADRALWPTFELRPTVWETLFYIDLFNGCSGTYIVIFCCLNIETNLWRVRLQNISRSLLNITVEEEKQVFASARISIW